ncbi:MAG: hypothetical protein ACK55I_09300, partial [bacterium]
MASSCFAPQQVRRQDWRGPQRQSRTVFQHRSVRVTQLQLKYRPPGAVLRSFLRDDTSFFRGLMGPFGSGKSTGCVVDVIRRAQLQRPGIDGVRRSRWAVVRN